MTPRLTIQRATFNYLAATLMLLTANAYAQNIPSRAEQRAGRLILSESLQIQMTRIAAGFQGRKKFTLLKSGKVVWQSGPVNANINIGDPGVNGEFVRLDLDATGRLDWLALFLSTKIDAASSYDYNFDGVHSWTEDESRRELGEPWRDLYCSGLSGLIVLDDEKTVYLFNYDDAPDPFMHRNPYVQGKTHYSAVARGVAITSRLEQSSPIPPKIWKSIQQLVEKRSCNTPDKISKTLLPADQRIDWQLAPQPFGLDWRAYIDEGLAMYRRAKNYYETHKTEYPQEDRLTKKLLGVFDLHAFFETFAFDEIDPERKLPEYTAMLNDFAFYQLAPHDAEDARGFDERRTPVEQGVVAMLAHVIRRDPDRTAAYLNLADALWRNNQDLQAAGYYKEYVARSRATRINAKIPSRAIQRSKAG